MSKELDDIITENITNDLLTDEMKIEILLNFDPYSTEVKMTWQETDDEIRRIHTLYNTMRKIK